MATIRDVAKLAGVAPITVSRVLNKSGYVSPETQLRVEVAAAGERGAVGAVHQCVSLRSDQAVRCASR